MKLPKLKMLIPLRFEWYAPGGVISHKDEAPDIMNPFSYEDIEKFAKNSKDMAEYTGSSLKTVSKILTRTMAAIAIEFDFSLPREIRDVRIWQLTHKPKKQRLKRRNI
jgi:hypothetical protein